MKKFKDLTKGDKFYEVYSDKLITHEVGENDYIEKTTIIPIKALKGDEKKVYIEILPGIYRGFFTSLDEAKMGLKTNLETYKERVECRIKEIKESLEKEEAKLLHIMNNLQNL